MQNSIEKIGITIERNFEIAAKNKNLDSKDLRLRETAKDFEKIFVTQLIKSMWKTIPKDEEPKIPGEDIYLEMMQSALANEMVKGKGMGISEMLYRQFKESESDVNTVEIEKKLSDAKKSGFVESYSQVPNI